MSQTVDLLLAFNFLKRLTTNWKDTDAFKLGLVDDKGNKLKKPETKEEKDAYTYMDRLVFNIKRLIGKLPFGQSTLASYAAALWLLKEETKETDYTEEELTQLMDSMMEEMKSEDYALMEEIANATGPAVVGTGDTGDAWKHDARRKKTKEFLRRYMESKGKREALKKRSDFMKQFGLN